MREDICSIPVNDVFMPKDGCPFCRMRDMLEAFAARDSEYGGHTIRHGDILGLKNGKLEYIEKDPVSACVRVTRSLATKRTSFVTLIYGEGITQEQAEDAKRRLEEKLHSDVEITLVNGGQPVYYFIISVE